MKDQYFGDIGDYKKYSILRSLTKDGALTVVVCWMLTDNDGRSDGRHIQYLTMPAVWRHYDPAVFDLLARAVLVDGIRHVALIQDSQLVSHAVFFSERLSDGTEARSWYFQRLRQVAEHTDVVFFDPDNGMEVASVKYGARNSNKYLYWHEAVCCFRAGNSLLLYQHFTRTARDPLIRQLAVKALKYTDAGVAFSLRTSHSVYLLLPQAKHMSCVDAAVRLIGTAWGSAIVVAEHTSDAERTVGLPRQMEIF